MKRSLALAMILASGFALNAVAQTSAAAPAGPTKIAVIAFQAAVGQTNEFQRNFADLQKKFTPQARRAQDAQRRSRQSAKAVAGAGREAERRRACQPCPDHRREEEAVAALRRRRTERFPAGNAGTLWRRSFQGGRSPLQLCAAAGYTLVWM